MAYTLSLLYNGSTAVNFLGSSGTSWCLLRDGGLSIGEPKEKHIWAGRTTATNSRRLVEKMFDNRTITLYFEINGDDRGDILDMQQTIYGLIDSAERRQINNSQYEVLLKYQVDDASGAVYFEVLSGDLAPPDDFMSLEKLNWKKGAQLSVKDWKLTLICKPFARGDEVQIVTNQTVYSIDDATYNNYVSWSGTSINGDVAGPLRIRYENEASTAATLVVAGLRDIGTPANFEHVLEALDSTAYGSPSTVGSHLQWGSITYTDQELCYWDITPTSGLDYKGRVRVIAVTELTGFSTSARFYIRSSYLGLTTLKTNPDVRIATTSDLIDLGIVDLDPAGLPPEYYGDTWRLSFGVKVDSGQTITVSLRALLLFPVDDYKYRKYQWHGYNLPQNQSMEDIGRIDTVGMYTTGRMRIVEPYGLPIHAEPGQDARLYFTAMSSTTQWDDDRSATVNVWHTPYYYYVRGTG